MRKFGFAVMTVLAAGFGTLLDPAPARAAYDYPWCIQGRDWGYPGECSYQTYEQCMASASGRNVYCGINPRVAFDRAR
ncbi:DUF3551 domain-containing protein [Bradyrhizobium sp. STM 3562]|uniref:DUF3551 domain-containing protein n=1 Tax=Bradyrhizobium sp. STM 3562 TaxID=578924 RepID=UPI00388D983E